jgi:hypothetical protein
MTYPSELRDDAAKSFAWAIAQPDKRDALVEAFDMLEGRCGSVQTEYTRLIIDAFIRLGAAIETMDRACSRPTDDRIDVNADALNEFSDIVERDEIVRQFFKEPFWRPK